MTSIQRMSSENGGLAPNQFLHHGYTHSVEVGQHFKAVRYLITTLAVLVPLKYQQQPSKNDAVLLTTASPTTVFQSHSFLITTFIVALLIFSSSSAFSETRSKIADRVGTLASTLAVICLVFLLVRPLGWILLCLWFVLFISVAYTLREENVQLFSSTFAESVERLVELGEVIRSRIRVSAAPKNEVVALPV